MSKTATLISGAIEPSTAAENCTGPGSLLEKTLRLHTPFCSSMDRISLEWSNLVPLSRERATDKPLLTEGRSGISIPSFTSLALPCLPITIVLSIYLSLSALKTMVQPSPAILRALLSSSSIGNGKRSIVADSRSV